MLEAIVLAAGAGTRMRSALPKVLHPLAGRPLLAHVIAAVHQAGIDRLVVVIGAAGSAVAEAARAACPPELELAFAVQTEPRGTGHAVQCATAALDPRSERVLILAGDVPGIRGQTCRELLAKCGAGLALATFWPDDPTGYGRILRDARGAAWAIREHRDCSARELAIRECNAGIYAIGARALGEWAARLTTSAVTGELYLTQLVELAHGAGAQVATIAVDADEVAGVNTPEQLAALERRWRDRPR